MRIFFGPNNGSFDSKEDQFRFFVENFFGITDALILSVHRNIARMVKETNWSYWELYNLPTGLRDFYFNETNKIFEEEAERMKANQNK